VGYDQQVAAQAEQGRLGLGRRDVAEQLVALDRVGEATREVRRECADAFDGVDNLELEARIFDLGGQLVRVVEVGGGPARLVRGVAVLAVYQVAVDDLGEPRVTQPTGQEPVGERGEPADGRGSSAVTRSTTALKDDPAPAISLACSTWRGTTSTRCTS
jgi:hypothetical protein